MSLDVYLYDMAEILENSDQEPRAVWDRNITHNLGRMAGEAGIYFAMWRPEEIGIKYAYEVLPILEAGLKKLKTRRKYFSQFNPENGWGSLESLMRFLENYIEACRTYPNAVIQVSR